MIVFIDYGVTEDCKNLEESYGEICVKCNKCGRFDAEYKKEEGEANKMKKKETEQVAVEAKVTRAKQFKDGGVVFDMVVNGVSIYGCRVIEGKNGDFISFPAYKGSDGKYYSHCWVKLSEDDTKAIVKQVEDAL